METQSLFLIQRNADGDRRSCYSAPMSGPTSAELHAEAWARTYELIDLQLAPLGLRAIDMLCPKADDRVLDVGCGAGQTLLQLASAPQLNDTFKQARIWPKRQPLYKGALNRLTPAHLAKLLGYCGQLELKIKGEHDEPWSELAELCLRFNPRYQGFTLS